jgi:hypothetical protein
VPAVVARGVVVDAARASAIVAQLVAAAEIH